MIEFLFKYLEFFEKFGIELFKGVFFYGLLGMGKIFLVKVVVNEVNVYFIVINGLEIMSKYYGESEERFREVFKEVEENVLVIIFIDEIDSIVLKREEIYGEVEKRVVS